MRSALIAAVVLLVGCGDDSGDPVERPTTFGGERPVQLQVPAAFDETRTYPLVVVLHGYGANGFVQQAFLKLGTAPDTYGVFVLAPDGLVDSNNSQFWNADPACCDFGGTGVDDVAYLGGLIDDVMEAWPVDPAQVSLIGHSNGSFMAYRLACDRADVVTSIAGLAGLGTSTPCTPSAHVSVLHIHGDADATVPYEGGNVGAATSPSAVVTVEQWATRNGCTGTAAVSGRLDIEDGLAGDETVVTVTAGCPLDGAAELWTLEGGGHLPSINAAFPDELMGWLRARPRG
jgi:polyhydroxybutyrate depolymerase